MLKVVFKNLQKSDLAEDIVASKLNAVLDKFPEFKASSATAILEMENSRLQADPDNFNIKLILKTRKLGSIVFKRNGSNLYQAASLLTDRLLEVLHRAVEKRRDLVRFNRRAQKQVKHEFVIESQAAS